MQICKIEVGLPTCIVENNDIFELIKCHTHQNYNQIEDILSAFFKRTGCARRFWRENDRRPNQILMETAQKLFSKFDKSLLRVVISCGVAKYFAEPAHASIFCRKFGLTPTYAFDVSDGCMGWITALETLKGFVSESHESYALIISHEFPMTKGGAIYPSAFSIEHLKQLDYKMPALTVGEATTLTVVRLDSSSMRSERLEFPDGAEYCTMPFRNHDEFSGASDFIEASESFHAHYNEMSKTGARPSVKMLNAFLPDTSVNLIPHAYTHSFEKLAKFLNTELKIINYFSEYGNIATASIPLSLYRGCKTGDIDPNRPTYVWCASAGIKTAVMELNLATGIS